MMYSLCGKQGCCPAVRSTGEGMEIGEKGNLVKLKPKEWNALVNGIRSGKLGKI